MTGIKKYFYPVRNSENLLIFGKCAIMGGVGA